MMICNLFFLMGNFSYICNHCGKAINIDEKCVLIHVRHGKELGRTQGTYAGYGNVTEDDIFRNNDINNINSRSEMCTSELVLDDSLYVIQSAKDTYKKMINNELTLSAFMKTSINENAKFKLYNNIPISLIHFAEIKENIKITSRINLWDVLRKYQKEYFYLPTNPNMNLIASSGIVAYHSKCYAEETTSNLTDTDKNEKLSPSLYDSNQGWGNPKKEYM